MKLSAFAASFALVAVAAGTAAAQPAASAPAPVPAPAVYAQQDAPEKENSFNLSPISLLFGSLWVNYEHLWNGTHGLVVEAGITSSNGDAGNARGGGLAVGYRWHWSHKQNSGFLGVTYTQGIGTGYVETQVNDEPVEHYDMKTHSEMLTANIGKRWTIGDEENWNITARFGLGWGHHTATAVDDTMEAKQAEEDMNAILELFPIGIEAELSAGYNF